MATLKSVAGDIDKLLKSYDWYQCIGEVKRSKYYKGEEHLIIYCKKEPPKKIKTTLGEEYQTVKLVWKVIGEIVPLGEN